MQKWKYSISKVRDRWQNASSTFKTKAASTPQMLLGTINDNIGDISKCLAPKRIINKPNNAAAPDEKSYIDIAMSISGLERNLDSNKISKNPDVNMTSEFISKSSKRKRMESLLVGIEPPTKSVNVCENGIPVSVPVGNLPDEILDDPLGYPNMPHFPPFRAHLFDSRPCLPTPSIKRHKNPIYRRLKRVKLFLETKNTTPSSCNPKKKRRQRRPRRVNVK